MSEQVTKVEGSIGSIFMSESGGITPSAILIDDLSYSLNSKSFEEQIEILRLEQSNLKKLQEEDISAKIEMARKEGYELGYKSGQENGMADILAKNKSKIEQANQLIDSISEALEKRSREQSQMVSEAISDALVKSFFLASFVDKESILRITKAAMEALPLYAKTIKINCSESDFAVVNESNANIPVKVDDTLSPGEVFIDSDVGLVMVTGQSITEKLLDKIMEER